MDSMMPSLKLSEFFPSAVVISPIITSPFHEAHNLRISVPLNRPNIAEGASLGRIALR
jgi:hypothetical protein